MRSDLLSAYASLDWAASNFPSFQTNLSTWIKENVDIVFKSFDSNSSDDHMVLIKRTPFPLRFNAEFGAYINTIRSALDMLAIALAKRNGQTVLNNLYFPIADSYAKFLAPNGKWSDLKKAISSTEANFIERLKPYREGNDLLWYLHKLDITRKHHRLLAVRTETSAISFNPGIPNGGIDFRTGHIAETDTETVLAFIQKSVGKPEVKFFAEVFINEPDISLRQPAVMMLERFSYHVRSILDSFNN